VVLTGMKRVGISNFLKYILYHPGISEKYLNSDKHFFIPVDLNDLVEREIYPFWVLTFKRVSDSVENSLLPEKIKKQVETYFLDSIQSQDLFLTIDNLRKSLVLITEKGYLPTIFFLRFDRIKDATTHDFFANFQGLIDATHAKLSYVFTSDRTLDYLVPEVFTKQSVSVFADNLYVKPAEKQDAKIIFDSRVEENGLILDPELAKQLLKYVDGHAQYLIFALISLGENSQEIKVSELFDFLKNDERILLQSEELWESLSVKEQEILLKVVNKEKLNQEEIKNATYLINTGFFEEKTNKIFSPIFEHYSKFKLEEKKKDKNSSELSKKEHMLLSFLEENKNEICEREEIIEAVWPEAEEIGVTDWAIDRLVARLRAKMTSLKKDYEIVTVKTRGYKLIERE
jgi:DNA-binding winged helix-turn-helix (wHTH) protein